MLFQKIGGKSISQSDYDTYETATLLSNSMKEEYVCPIPFDIDTANIGLRWWACQALQNFTGNGEGVEWAVNEP